MNGQTGPAPKQSMDHWLLWTGITEIFDAVIFFFLWRGINRLLPGRDNTLSLLGLLTLDIILFEGGLYWLLARAHFFQKTPALPRYRLLKALYMFNILLILVFPGLMLVRAIFGYPSESADMLLGGGFFIFGFGEFLHYFVCKINMRPYERKISEKKHKFLPARLLRELRQARRELAYPPGLQMR